MRICGNGSASISTSDANVNLPLESTVNVGMAEVLPYVPGVTAVFDNVKLIVDVPEPVASPVMDMAVAPGRAVHVGADDPLEINT